MKLEIFRITIFSMEKRKVLQLVHKIVSVHQGLVLLVWSECISASF